MRAALALTALGVALTSIPMIANPRPRLVWNATESAPVGLYRVDPAAAVSRGDLVLAKLPASLRRLAARRRYLPSNVPLVKRVAALDGDVVCAWGNTVAANGMPVARRLFDDRAGRPLPHWEGCRILDREVFLLMQDVPASFDGRYFGPVPASSVLGRLAPLWTE
jgi:conjugative transfer signal peptidase TraF